MSEHKTESFSASRRRMHPRFKHDCDTCKYIATVIGDDGKCIDWYIHEGGDAFTDAMVGRFGNEPSENITPYLPEAFEPYSIAGNENRYALSANVVVAAALRQWYSYIEAKVEKADVHCVLGYALSMLAGLLGDDKDSARISRKLFAEWRASRPMSETDTRS